MWAEEHPDSFSHPVLWCTNVTYNDSLDAVARILLNGLKLTKRECGETTVLETFETEQERVDAIEREFRVKLSQEEQDAIRTREMAVERLLSQSLE